jgi:hypothetical protein
MGRENCGEVTMRVEDKIPVRILVMDRHFLYLPLYVAQFDNPKIGKRPFFGKVPSRYSIEVKPPSLRKSRSDGAVFDALMDARLGSSDIMFAACDPTVLLARPDQNALMAASLISTSAFWAVNHTVRNMRVVSDLSCFDRIICYGEKTTSNLIARRIVKRDTGKLRVVDSTDEIQALMEFGEGTMAISPELLKIADLVHGEHGEGEKRYAIVLELSTSKEFSNVLTTALFTRAEVVEQHPDLVSGVLAGLQSALIAFHSGHPMVAECARHNFTDAYCVDEALAIARSSNVFPETIQVRRDRWQRACEFYHISNAVAEGREKSSLTKTEERNAEEVYKQAVEDRGLRRLVNEAITRGFLEGVDGGNAASADVARRTSRRVVIGAVGLLAAGFGVGHVFAAAMTPTAKVAMGASWAVMLFVTWLSADLFGYRKPSRFYAAHWASFVLFWWGLHEIVVRRVLPDAHFVAGLALDDVVASVIAGLAFCWILGAGFYVHNEAKKAASAGHER